MLWNLEAIKTLEDMGYFRDFNIEDELKKFKDSDRSKKPPRDGVVRFRPRGRLAKAPEIFAESNPT